MKELYRLLGIKGTPSTAHHPQTDGQTEWVNQEIKVYIRMFVNQRQDNWDEWLVTMEFAYNNCIHSATGKTPFEMDHGYHPYMGTELVKGHIQDTCAESFIEERKKIFEEPEVA